MTFSLIVATLNRSTELCEFLNSLHNQSYLIYEIIVVDQNEDDRVLEICRAYAGRLPVRHVRSHVRESSHARNTGLHLSRGDIVAFPDDDCVYPSDLLNRVAALFRSRPDLSLLSGPAVTPAGQLGSGRWNARPGPLTLDNVWTSVIEFNLFIRRSALNAVGPFNEELGVGARFGSGEAADLAIRVMTAGFPTFYDTAIKVIHPDKRLTEQATARAFSYGTGLGRVLRRHHPVSRTAISFFVRPLGGAMLHALAGRTLMRRYYWQTLRGRLRGYFAPCSAVHHVPAHHGTPAREDFYPKPAFKHERH